MAGDWIKMRRGLRHDPKVIAITRALSGRRDFMDWWGAPVRITCHENVTECVTFANVTRVTVCALLDVWAALNNTLGKDGKAPFMSLQDIDDIAEIPGFGEAMESVGWVVDKEAEGLVFPNFSENNNPTKSRPSAAKTDAERAREYRERKRAQANTSDSVTPSRHVTTEKRREEKSINNEYNTRAQGVPILEEVKTYSVSLPMPTKPETAEAFFDTMEACGWVTRAGHPVADWRAAYRRYASVWNQSEKAAPARVNGRNDHRQEKRAGEFPEKITLKEL